MDSLISLDAKVSSPWGAFLGLVWSGSQNIWEDGTAWDYQNFGQGHTPYITWICEICERNLATKHLNGCTDQIESANCFKLGFNPDGTWSSVPAEKCFDTRNQPTDCFCKRPVWKYKKGVNKYPSALSLCRFHNSCPFTEKGSYACCVDNISSTKMTTVSKIFYEPGTKDNEILCPIWGSMMLRCSKDRTQTLEISQKWVSLLSTKDNRRHFRVMKCK